MKLRTLEGAVFRPRMYKPASRAIAVFGGRLP